MLKDKKAVIFDLDGTLVDSMWIWREIDERFLGQYGLQVPEGLNDLLEGFSFNETAEYFKDNFPLPLSIQEIKDTWNHMAFEMYMNEIPLKEGAKEFLDILKEKNLPLGIATSNSRELTKACLDAHGIGEYFQYICTSNEVPKGKPAPDVYLKTAEKLSVSPEHILVFEDIPYGIMAGNRANMTTCAVRDSYSQAVTEKKKELADYYIETYFDIINGTYQSV